MVDVVVRHIDDMKSYAGQFVFAGLGLGISAWGMNVLRLPPGWLDYPEHDHSDDGQEEVYVVLEGDARLAAGAASFDMTPGVFVRVGPRQKRKIYPGPAGATILAIGGTPGKAYRPPDWLLKSAAEAS